MRKTKKTETDYSQSNTQPMSKRSKKKADKQSDSIQTESVTIIKEQSESTLYLWET